MFSPKGVKFLEGVSDSEATSNRPSFRRPGTPHPRKGKRKLLLDFEIAVVHCVNTRHCLTHT